MMLATRCRMLTVGLITASLALGLGCGGGGTVKKRDTGAGGGVGTGDGGSGGGAGGSGGRGGSGGGQGGSGGSPGTGGSGGSGGRDGATPDAGVDAAGDDGPGSPDSAPPDLAPDAPPPNFQPPVLPWLGKDIGAVGPQAGGAALATMPNAGQMFDLIGGGTTGIGGSADSLFFMYQQLAGAAVVQGRLFSLTMADPNSAAGFMIRESLDPDAAMVFVGAVGDGTGGKVIMRRAKGQPAVFVPMEGVMTSLRPANNTVVRLVRSGSTVRIHAGASGAVENDSTLVGGGMAELTLASATAPLFYGGAVSSGHATNPAMARFNEISVHNLASNTATAGWTHYAIGSSGASAVWTTNKLTISGLGQPWGAVMGTQREFLSFAYLRNNEPNSVRFLVTAQAMTDPNSRVAAMIRDVNNFSRAAATIALSLTQSNGLELGHRMMAGEANELVKVLTRAGVRAPLWLRLDRAFVTRPGDPLGARDAYVTAFYAEDNNGTPRAWQQLGSPVLFPSSLSNLPAHGIAVSSFVPTAYHHADITRVQVVPSPAPTLPDGGAGADGSATDASGGDDAAADAAPPDATTSG